MRKGHSITGLQVIAQDSGAHLGPVLDLVFDHDANQCLALLLRDRGLFKGAQVVLWNDVSTIGKDAVLVRSGDVVVDPYDVARLRELMETQNDTHLSGTKIMSEDGRDLGSFADVYVDETTGQVVGYEVSGGFVSDTMSGKRFVPATRTDDLRVGEDVILASPDLNSEFERQATENPGGLKGAMSSAGESTSGAFATVKDKVTETYSNVADASVEKQKEFVVGKTAGRDVFLPASTGATAPVSNALTSSSTPRVTVEGQPVEATVTSLSTSTASSATAQNGSILVRSGEVITQQHTDQAEQAGVLGQLLTAAGAHVGSGLLGSAQEKLSGGQQNASEAAIGKSAGREVLLPNGSTLVAPGMIITQEMMDLARSNGKEPELIASAGLGAASEGAQGALASASGTAGGLFDSLKEKVAELTGTAQEKKAEYDDSAQQKKINNALGRPVTRIILDQNDAVILNTGDIITHKAVDMARSADMLDVLLDSVYDSTPDITPEMMRAQEPGVAALPEQAQPASAPITATVTPDQPAQSTPSQGQLPS